MRIQVEGATTDSGIRPFEFKGQRVHLIGIGGSGMSGAARMLVDPGAIVSGSDLQPFDGLGTLVHEYVRVTIGHHEEHLHPNVELVVISAAIPESNPELTAARRRGLRVIKYAELLGALMTHRTGVAIAGTHGKSTTTAICAHLFREAGIAPSFVIGARSEQLGGNSGLGSGPHLIVESCEFDRSFLHLRPHAAAILNIEPDHLDCYRNLEEITAAFGQLGVCARRSKSPDTSDTWSPWLAHTSSVRGRPSKRPPSVTTVACALPYSRPSAASTSHPSILQPSCMP